MDVAKIFLFFIFCGLLGLTLKRNFLNILVAFMQIIFGINGIMMTNPIPKQDGHNFIYLIIFAATSLVFFSYSIAILMIRRRSTLNVNELTELRG